MTQMKLFSGPLSMFGMKAEIAALEKGLDVEVVQVHYAAETGYNPKHPEVARINPKAQVPVLIDGDLEIFDSTQIFEYFEDVAPVPALWPADPKARARARQLELAADEIYFPQVVQFMIHYATPDGPEANAARENCFDYYKKMDARLGESEYLAGGFTYADIAFYMAHVFGERLGAPVQKATPHLLRWQKQMTERACVKPVMTTLARYLKANNRLVPPFMEGL